jgi:putative ABC transport system permease protein
MRVTQYFEELGRDVAHAFRQFGRQARFWSTVFATLVVGIAASTCIFAVVDGVVLKPLPYRDPEHLIALNTWSLRGEYVELSKRAQTFDVAAYYPGRIEVTVNTGAEPARLAAAGVTHDLFDVLGVRPALGRAFTEDETRPGGPGIVGGTYWRTYGVVILSDRVWRDRFGASDAAIGGTVSIEGVAHTIVGVMPRGFAFPSGDVDLWFPHNIDPANLWPGNVARQIGRLRSGYEIEDARQELRALMPTFRDLIPWGASLTNYGAEADVRSLTDFVVGEARPGLLVLLSAIGAMLLVVCVNVANLLLARGAARERELATRAALGAGRRRLVRQLLVENVTVATIAGAIGTLLAFTLLRAIVVFLPPDLPRIGEIAIDLRVTLFAVGLSLVTGIAFGLLPALRVTRGGHGSLVRGAARGGLAGTHDGRLTRALAAAEFALALVLVVAATLLARSFWNLVTLDLGFNAQQLVAAAVAPPGFQDAPPPVKHQFAARLLEQLEATGGVEGAAVASSMPFDSGLFANSFQVENPPVEPEGSNFAEAYLGVSAEYFRTMGTAIVRGRGFTAADRADSPRVAIVSERLARLNWGDEDPIGRRLRFRTDPRQPVYDGEQFPWFTVVGVAEDVNLRSVSGETPATLYLPFEQFWDFVSLRVLVRTAGESGSIAPRLRSIVASIDPLTPVSDVRTFEARVGDNVARPRFTAYLLGTFAAIAIFLAAIGVYGVLAYSMSQRVGEIGVRVAFGASAHDVFGMLFRQGVGVIAVGIAIGLPLAFGAAQLLSSLLYGVVPSSVAVLGGALALSLVGLAASFLPAYRAVRIDPVEALRQE